MRDDERSSSPLRPGTRVSPRKAIDGPYMAAICSAWLTGDNGWPHLQRRSISSSNVHHSVSSGDFPSMQDAFENLLLRDRYSRILVVVLGDVGPDHFLTLKSVPS